MAYFDERWPVPTDFVGADNFDELWWNVGDDLDPGLTPIPPSLDLPGTVVDLERDPASTVTAATVILTSEGGVLQAGVHWPTHATPQVLPAGVGPAWELDGLEVGKSYVFTVEVMEVEDNSGEGFPPSLFLHVLGTSQATDPAGPAWDYTAYSITFTAEDTTHHVALLTDSSWSTGGGNQEGAFTFWMRAVSLEDGPPRLSAAFHLAQPVLEAGLVDENVWDDPEPDDPDAGGSVEPPEEPEPSNLPAELPETVWVALLDENGDELTGDGYERVEVPASDWVYDDDTEELSNDEDLVSSTPTGVWPPVGAAAIFSTSTGGTPVSVSRFPAPIVPTGPIVFTRGQVVTPFKPNPRLRRVSPVYPEPMLDPMGFPANWDYPTSVVDEVYGRVQIVVEGVDISNFLYAPTPVPEWSRGEPFGPLSATIRLPQVTAFHNTAAWGWCRKGANVDIRMIRNGQTNVRRFSGYVSTFGHDEDTGVFSLECIGALFQADQQLRLPASNTKPKDIGTVIRQTLNSVVGRRYASTPKRKTGCKTSTVGAWEPRVTGYIQQLLATAIDKNGRQWTVACEARNPQIKRKDTSTVSWTVVNGQPGVRIRLQSDDTPNVLYGEGVREDGGRWRNMRYPNWRPDDTPPFPNWSPIRSIGVGTRDEDTDSGDGVSVWQAKVGRKVTGRFTSADRAELRERQKAAGILVDGYLGPQSWAAEFSPGSNTGSLDGAFPMPLAYSKKVMPRLHAGDGSDLGPNPDYDPDVIRVEEKIDFGQGVTLQEGRRAAKAQLKRDGGVGWTGEVAFTNVDPQECSRFDVVEGSNGLIKYFRGQDLKVHVSQVDYGPDEVVAHVDTKARDYPTLQAIRERERNATDPAKAYVKRQTQSKLGSDRAEWDAESPGGRVPRHAVHEGLWTVLRIPVAAYGSVVRTTYRASGPAAKFTIGVFDRPITAAKLNSLLGNPLTAGSNPWVDHADTLEDLGLLMAWGEAHQPCGYYPGSYSTPDGEDQSPLTGRMVDDASWDFASTNPPWLWVAELADRNTFLQGRFYPGV